ncbi:MAG: hypothetical protein ACI9VN_000278 [Patescibacteria group bacterium]|jgi:hypothetical protein
MLQIRPSCENCNKTLPPNSTEARICTFECTFCSDCVDNTLHNVCPNCGGGFVNRPVRPKDQLVKYPATEKVTYKPVDMESFSILLEKNRKVKMEDR